MFSGQSFLHRLSVVLGSDPDRTTSHFLIKTTLISFLAYYTECPLTKLFLYSRSLHYYFLYPFYISLTSSCVCRPIVLSIKRIYHQWGLWTLYCGERRPSSACSRVGVGSSPTRRLEPSGSLP